MNEKKVTFVKADNPKMIEAYEKARETFKYFWRELSWEYRRIVPALNLAYVKVALTQKFNDSDEPITEHLWMNDVEFDGNNVKGVLINSPNEITNVKMGDLVEVPLFQLSDWLFAMPDAKAKGGISKIFSSASKAKTYGGFTIQAIRSEMTNQELKEHDKAWGLDFGDCNEILLAYQQKENPENLVEHPMSINMKESIIKFIKENPNEITFMDENGYTFLHREVIAGNLTSVKILLEAGADKNIKTNQGETALDFAVKLKWAHIISVLKN